MSLLNRKGPRTEFCDIAVGVSVKTLKGLFSFLLKVTVHNFYGFILETNYFTFVIKRSSTKYHTDKRFS